MPIKAYHKLVRDRIPEIIEADGKTCVFKTLSDEEYICLARKKNTRAAQGSGTIRKKTVTRKGKEYVYWEAR